MSKGHRRATATSNFGVGRRESHDASAFYERFTGPTLSDDETLSAPSVTDEIWVGDSRQMDTEGDIADGSVALVVTSPPYFAGKEYEQALGQGHIPASYLEYLQMLRDVFAECVRKLEPGGRMAINVANLGRKPYRSLSADVVAILEDLGLLMRGEIIWHKQRGAGGSCAWGTYQRPGNPVLRDLTERILVASKGRFDRARSARWRGGNGFPAEGSMAMDDFLDATTDLWEIPPESATRVGHPAPFPVELPRRLIELYTYRGDLVLDPFMGSGSTAVAAVRTQRHFVGFDTDPEYVKRALQRAQDEKAGAAEVDRTAPFTRIVVSPNGSRDSDVSSEAGLEDSVREGQRVDDLASRLLETAGFVSVRAGGLERQAGMEVDLEAIDPNGTRWIFLIAGARSSTRPGLRRTEVLQRCLGRAALLRAVRKDEPVVLLSVDLPSPSSNGARALKTAHAENLITGWLSLLSPDATEALARLMTDVSSAAER